jgi:antitoxin component of RelBE/YafQ-DinJ toxin-antitoxin module
MKTSIKAARVDFQVKEDLNDIAASLNKTMSELVREALIEYLAKHKQAS